MLTTGIARGCPLMLPLPTDCRLMEITCAATEVFLTLESLCQKCGFALGLQETTCEDTTAPRMLNTGGSVNKIP